MGKRYQDAEWLEARYWDDGLTQAEIAEECEVSATTIRDYMKEFGIERREVAGENHGLSGESRSPAVKEKISESLQGRELTEEWRRRIAESLRGNEIPEDVRQKISMSLTGISRDRETREKMSKASAGEANPQWKGGYSSRYGPGWAPAREAVIGRDEVCQACGHDGSENRLEVHHIVPVRVFRNDPSKSLQEAHELSNLVLLCNSCHTKADFGTLTLGQASESPHNAAQSTGDN